MPPKPDEPPTRTLSAKWSMSFPLVAVLLSIVLTNAGLWFNAQSKAEVLGIQFTAVAKNVDEIKGVLTKFTSETSAELRSLRQENTAIRERFATEVSVLKVEIAKLTALQGPR